MSHTAFVFLAFAMGIVAGLRAFTPFMVVSWAACLHWINVQGTWAGFLGHKVTAIILTIVAAGELVGDLRPSAPSRKIPSQFGFRIFSGAFSGAALAAGVGLSGFLGVVCGGVGAVAGTLGGYDARTGLVKFLNVRDRVIAIPEDVIAVGGGFLLASAFRHWA